MNPYRARGLAVLALLSLSLLPRVSAVTIVQTFTGSGVSPLTVPHPSVSTPWTIAQFDSNLGTLLSVSLNAQFSGHASSTDLNGLPVAEANNPVLDVQGGFILVQGGQGGFTAVQSYVKTASDPLLIQPFSWVSYGMDYSTNLSAAFGPIDWFVGSNTRTVSLFVVGSPGSDSAGAQVSATNTATLTYVYQVPDAWSTASLFALALFSLALYLPNKSRQ